MRGRIVQTTGLIVASDFVTKAALLALDGFIVATLPTGQFAAFLVFAFWVRFAPYCGFGALAYLNKLLPQQTGPQARDAVIDKAARLTLIFVSVYALGAAALLILNGDKAAAAALGVMSLIQIATLQQTVSRGIFAFPVYILSQSLQAVSVLGLGLALMPTFGVEGLYAAFMLSYLVAIGAWFVASRQRLLRGPAWQMLAHLSLEPVRSGGWFFLLGAALFGMQSLDRFAVLNFGGDDAQVAFGAGFIFYQLGIICVNSVGKVATPVILARRAQPTGDDGAQAGTNILFLFCAAVFFLCLAAFLAAIHLAPGLVPVRFLAVRDLAVFYLASGFITALGLSCVPLLLKRSVEERLFFVVCGLCLAVVAGLWGFVDVIEALRTFALLSVGIACCFAAATVALVAAATGSGAAPGHLALRTGTLVLVAATPFIVNWLALA